MYLENLNNKQRKAVKKNGGPILVFAGAGSGKTRVLTHKIAYLIDEIGLPPDNILAVTFTNKAAQEMKSRVVDLIETDISGINIGTFHSISANILRREIKHLGYDNNFTIYDQQDSRSVVKTVIKELNLEELYKLKDLNHNDIRIWVLNNTNQRGLAAKIRDCLEKGYHIGDKHIKGDYNILKQDNFDGSWRDGLKTEIFVHVDTINNPKFKSHLKEFLLFTGYSGSIVKYRYEKVLYDCKK